MKKLFPSLFPKENNVFTCFLEELKVKHTNNFSAKFYNEHPHKYNLFGLSKMLSEYKVENAGIKTKDKSKVILELEAPFIAYVSGDFAVISEINKDNISYLNNGNKLTLPISTFVENWNGTALIAETNEKTIEPDYQAHKKDIVLTRGLQLLFCIAVFLMFSISYLFQELYKNIGVSSVLLLNLIGIYISYLLVLKQMNIQSKYADKICSLLKQHDCNNILESKAAKFFDIIGWSEIGLGYFIANAIIILFFPFLLNYIILTNIVALCYSVWSIWYQKFKAKQWCILCVIVQLIFWIIFLVSYLFNLIHLPIFTVSNIIQISCIYLIPIIFINQILPVTGNKKRTEKAIQELNSIKANDEIFAFLLKKQTRYNVPFETSKILFGNPDAQIRITILTNPHCNPCAITHKKVNQILKHNKNNLCVQYIFSSFSSELNSSSQFLISTYLKNDIQKSSQIIDEWFEKGKLKKEIFFERYLTNIQDPIVKLEFEKHDSWVKQSGLHSTPTILINGYKLPENYKIEDLTYITKIDL